MTDKVQKMREEVVRLKSQLLRGACSSQVTMETRCKEEAYNEVLAILDSMQEEPVSEDLDLGCGVIWKNEAPKSKFVYPDKLYARTNNNITLDISYAPQTLEAVEYTRTDAFIEKAAEWIKNKAENYIVDTPLCSYFDYKRAVEDFKDYIK